MSLLADPLRIGKARVRNPGLDATALRLRLEHALNLADLSVPGLPPSALLFVRSLRDPAPGSLRLRSLAEGVPAVWERALRERLATLAASARRPAAGAVEAGAEAVVFADLSEMLACLARDLTRGEAAGRWWWRNLLHEGGPEPGESLARVFAEQVRCLPAVLHRLAEWGEAARVLAAIPPRRCRDLLAALCREYQMPPPGPEAVPPAPVPSAASAPVRPEAAPVARGPADRPAPAASLLAFPEPEAPGRTPAAEPWLGLIAEPAATLPREARCLLGLGLSLYRVPAAVRGEAFRTAWSRWWRESRTPEPPAFAWSSSQAAGAESKAERPVPESPGAGPPPAAVLQPAAPGAAGPAPVDVQPPPQPAAHLPAGIAPASAQEEIAPVPAEAPALAAAAFPPPPPTETPAAAQPAAMPAADLPPAPLPAAAPAIPPAVADASGPVPRNVPPAGAGTPAADSPAVAAAAAEIPNSALPKLENGVETALGGALYLINLMRDLDLPGCFDAGWELSSRLGAWGTLEALCRGLLDGDGTCADDPLWAALAGLAGRAPEAPLGAGVADPGEFRLPPAWPGRVGDAGPWLWAAEERRLRLWSAQGYLLADVAGPEADAAGAAALAAAYGAAGPPVLRPSAGFPPAAPDNGLAARAAPGLRAWLAQVLPFVRLRLRKALRHGGGDAELAAAVLRHPGRLYLSGSHVDLVLGLDRVAFGLRVAGLDRDPGWLPEFGRVVLFHFE